MKSRWNRARSHSASLSCFLQIHQIGTAHYLHFQFFCSFFFFPPWNRFVPEPPKQSGQVFVRARQWSWHTYLLFRNPGCFLPAKTPSWLPSWLICSSMRLQGKTGTKWLPVSVQRSLTGRRIERLCLITETGGEKCKKKISFRGAVQPESFTGLTLSIPSSDEHISDSFFFFV